MQGNERNFNNIKIHTQYSICEGAIKVDELAEYCKINKIKSLGLTDTFNLCGALEFSEKLSKVGTQPIIGTQINLRANNITGKITLYAQSEIGYKNLTKLSSLSYLNVEQTKDPACEIKDLIENKNDLILLSGNYRDFFGKLYLSNKVKDFKDTIRLLKKSFKDKIYFELQRHGENEEKNFENFLLEESKTLDIPLIATQEVFYLNSEMYEAHDTLMCIGTKNFVDDKNRLKLSDQHYLKDNKDLIRLYSDVPEALENNFNFHLRFNFKPKKSKPILPSIAYDQNTSPESELIKQAQKGLEDRLTNHIFKKKTTRNRGTNKKNLSRKIKT